ncbi:alpha/beta fold hydrolase [Flavobacterium sp. ENC]|uniref:alpha/beta fold hydrolase n=1 Tax=Flavobacterium sp. ENC TaxID=2897330 RepID=UPI001E5DF329|nr:alpha/beta hydrolase [Flavobacterium sp. ENC]MCD0467205.1 alpha/beta hydrolase [Flavobacterium sp. ENC]
MKTVLKNQINFRSVCCVITACLLVTGITSCRKDDPKEQRNVVKVSDFTPNATFVVNNAEENMPVWVHGNKESKSIILVMHGGPGSDVLDFRMYQDGLAFKKIEVDYQVAYWQQRASGQSKGSDNSKYYTIDQYVDDADKVVDQLRKNYPEKKIVLFAHSWGGMLSASYLKDEKRRNKIAGWIDAAGAHNGTTLLQTTTDDINAEADARIAAGKDAETWKEIKEAVKEQPEKVNSLAYLVTSEIPEVVIKVNNADFKFTSRADSSNPPLFKEIVKRDNNPFLADIKMPCLVLWGKYDFAVSRTYQKEFLKNIGSKDVTNVDFNASGHYMMFHEPDLFARSVIDFMGKYKL